MVEILNSLTGGASAEIVEAGDDDEALAGFVEHADDVAEIGVRHVLQLGQRARGPDTDHRASGVELAIEGFDRIRRLLGGESDVNSGKDAARERQQVGGKDELRFGETGVFENFGRVAVGEKI